MHPRGQLNGANYAFPLSASSMLLPCGKPRGINLKNYPVKFFFAPIILKTNARCKMKNRIHPEKHHHIAIVGAGPAGIHMAYLLKKSGYNKITLFEKNPRVGGKSFSIQQKGIIHEMGTCYYTMTYKYLLELLKDFPDQEQVEIEPKLRTCIDLLSQEKLTIQWLEKHLKNIFFPTYLKWLPDVLSLYYLVKIIKSYLSFYPGFVQEDVHDIPQRIHAELRHELSIPMKEFLLQKNFPGLVPLFLLQNSSMCYGYPDTIPAYYGLYWMNNRFMRLYMDYLFGKQTHIMGMFAKGYQSIWEKIADTYKLDIILNSTVTRIDRFDAQTAENRIRLSYTKNDTQYEQYFDYLIYASPSESFLNIISHATDLEKKMFSKQIYSKVITRLVEINNPRKNHGIVYWLDNLKQENAHLPFAYRHSARILNNQISNEQLGVVYQYSEDTEHFTKEDFDNGFYHFLKHNDLKLKKEITQSTWNYFPRFTSEAIAEGLPWRVLELQGEHSTWHIGSSLCFESINAVMNFNHYIVDHLLKNKNLS